MYTIEANTYNVTRRRYYVPDPGQLRAYRFSCIQCFGSFVFPLYTELGDLMGMVFIYTVYKFHLYETQTNMSRQTYISYTQLNISMAVVIYGHDVFVVDVYFRVGTNGRVLST